MPIRPENRDRYPADWPEISNRIRFGRAEGRCECEGECGRGTHEGRCPNVHGGRAYGTGSPVVLTTAHLNHLPEDCRPENLKAMCQGCHLHYDREHHAETRATTADARRAALGQVTLLDLEPEPVVGDVHGDYRYHLERIWDSAPLMVTFIMLNPSTADANQDDPTIRRCIAFAKREGYGGLSVVNLYAFRATDPKLLLHAADPIGPDNDNWIRRALLPQFTAPKPVIVAWGAGAPTSRVAEIRRILEAAHVDVRSLGVTKEGHPRHPLYVRGDQPLVAWPDERIHT